MKKKMYEQIKTALEKSDMPDTGKKNILMTWQKILIDEVT